MLQIGIKIKEIRTKKGLLQKQVATAAGLHPANYNKMEKGDREPSLQALTKIAQLFAMSLDQIIHYEGDIPQEVSTQDKTLAERIKLIEQLDQEDQQALLRVIDGMLTKTKFKDFFQQQLAS